MCDRAARQATGRADDHGPVLRWQLRAGGWGTRPTSPRPSLAGRPRAAGAVTGQRGVPDRVRPQHRTSPGAPGRSAPPRPAVRHGRGAHPGGGPADRPRLAHRPAAERGGGRGAGGAGRPERVHPRVRPRRPRLGHRAAPDGGPRAGDRRRDDPELRRRARGVELRRTGRGGRGLCAAPRPAPVAGTGRRGRAGAAVGAGGGADLERHRRRGRGHRGAARRCRCRRCAAGPRGAAHPPGRHPGGGRRAVVVGGRRGLRSRLGRLPPAAGHLARDRDQPRRDGGRGRAAAALVRANGVALAARARRGRERAGRPGRALLRGRAAGRGRRAGEVRGQRGDPGRVVVLLVLAVRRSRRVDAGPG
ncbi:hypothetical protein SAMN04489747_2166 [Auraticoccus monumenti]|uniref:Uncharacterized protein n=1 Tax=Auraticoccus monumenti TaxID=675864 RepID=A0A1G6Z3Y6_9ACTN|nr:hypothetical protein SAMN04489747_2166 [Auraticoccus monumenti]